MIADPDSGGWVPCMLERFSERLCMRSPDVLALDWAAGELSSVRNAFDCSP